MMTGQDAIRAVVSIDHTMDDGSLPAAPQRNRP